MSVTVGAHVSTFVYDGLDRRVELLEADGGTTTNDAKFVWCGLAMCESRDSSGATVLKRYLSQGVQDNGTSYFYTLDHLGSVRELTDTSGIIRARYDYDAWGRRTKISGDKDAETGYTGHYQHTPSGVLLAPYRGFDPSLGRWLSEDPIGLPGGTNRYAYVENNPAYSSDPLGLQVGPPPTGPPPIPLPPGKNGEPNVWIPGKGRPDGDRPIRYKPKYPVDNPKGGQPSSSWDDKMGHWDGDDGLGNRTHYDRTGRKVPPGQIPPEEPPMSRLPWWLFKPTMPPIIITIDPCRLDPGLGICRCPA